MISPRRPDGRESRLSRLGVPSLNGHGNYVVATAIDSTGTGLVVTFIIIYFAKTTPVSLAAIGAAITLARVLASPTAVLVGPLLDRWGARRMAAAGNLFTAVGFAGFLFTHSVWQIVVVALINQIGQATYWTSAPALVMLASSVEDRTRWFGFVHALRNSGLALGGALGSALLVIGNVSGLHAIALGNAASCVIAAILLMRWRPIPALVEATTPDAPGQSSARASYSTVLRDGRYLLLIGINITFVFAALIINVLLAIYIVNGLHRGAWIAGALMVVSCAQVSLTQTAISKRLDRYRMTRVLVLASVLNAAAFGVLAYMDVAPGWTVIPGLFFAMLVLTAGETVTAAPTGSLSVSLAKRHARGRYLAVYQLSWTFGQVAAPGVFTFLLARGTVLPLLFLLTLSVTAVPLLLRLERLIGRAQPAAAVHNDELVAA